MLRVVSRRLTPSLQRCRWASTLKTPFISDTIPLAEGRLGTVEEILAEVGQDVAVDEVVAVVETDKVALDIKATHAGRILEILVELGDEVKEEQSLFSIDPK